MVKEFARRNVHSLTLRSLSFHRSGCVICAFYLIANEPEAAAPSIGFPGYVYPNEEVCAMYEGVPCENDTTQCCYNVSKWCASNGENCQADVRWATLLADGEFTCFPVYSILILLHQNGAWPIGDQRSFGDQMTDAQSLSPFPNAVFWNWATIFILAFGNREYPVIGETHILDNVCSRSLV